jgi:hypothetical protein
MKKNFFHYGGLRDIFIRRMKMKTIKSLSVIMLLLAMIIFVSCGKIADFFGKEKEDEKATYTEGDVYVSELGSMIHYYFSNDLEGIEFAASENGFRLSPNIRNAAYDLNPILSNDVKSAMTSRSAIYSLARIDLYITSCNKKVGDAYYTAVWSY